MGNHRLEHRRFHVNIVPPIVLEVVVVETHKQHVGVRVIQSFYEGIITIGLETIIVSNINVVKRWVLIGSVIKLGSESNGVSVVRNLS